MKILETIAELKARLRKLRESEFESLHEDVLLLSRLICTNKKQSRSIENFVPPLSWTVQLVSSEHHVVNTIAMTDKKANQKTKRDFKTTRLVFLKEAERFYIANLSLRVKKDDAISKKLRSIQKDIQLMKSKIGVP